MSESLQAVLLTGLFAIIVALIGAHNARLAKRDELAGAKVAADMRSKDRELEQLRADYTELMRIVASIGERHGDAQLLQPVSVLLIEDEDADAKLTEAILMQHDQIAHVSWVHTVEESAEIHADVILADLGLVSTSGVDTVDAILRIHPRTPVVVLTDHEELGDEARAHGAVDFVPKPWRKHDTRLATAVIRAKTARILHDHRRFMPPS